MGGPSSPHDENDADWWKNDESPGVERVHLPEEIGKEILRNAGEFMTTTGRMMDALLMEGGGIFDDVKFTGENQGSFLHGGELYHLRDGLIHVAELKERFGVKDEDIDGVIKSMTPEGAYVVWSVIEEHFSQIQELTSEIKDGGDE